MSISRQQQLAIARHGLYLVPNTHKRAEPAHSSFVYRLAAVAAALFLAMTVC